MADLGFLSYRANASYPLGLPSRNQNGIPSYSSATMAFGGYAELLSISLRNRTLPAPPPLVIVLTLNEGLNLSEALLASISTTTSVSESLAFSEALTAARVVPIFVGDTLTLSEVGSSQLASYLSDVAENLTLSESLAATGLFDVPLLENLSYSESLAVQMGSSVSVSETLSLSELLSSQVNIAVSVFDTVSLSELLSLQLQAVVNLPVTHFFSEALSPSLSSQVTVSESLTLLENVGAFTSGVVPIAPDVLRVSFSSGVKYQGTSNPIRFQIEPLGAGVPVKVVSAEPVYNLISTGLGTLTGNSLYSSQFDLSPYNQAVAGQLLRVTSGDKEWFGSVVHSAGSVVTLDAVLPLFEYPTPTWTLYSAPYGVDLTISEATEGEIYRVVCNGLVSLSNRTYNQTSSFVATAVSPSVSSVAFQQSDASVTISFSEDMALGYDLSQISVTGPGSPRVVSSRWIGPRILYLTTTGVGSGTYTLTLPGFKDLSLNPLV